MDFFDVLTLLGGLALFLFGMNLMGAGLEKRAGNRLRTILGSLTSNQFKGFLLGLGITAIIQSSSATTVMVVGFVNSGILTLRQAVGVIMGANLGTSVTSWLLSLTSIEGDSFIVSLLKPSSFTPVLAFVGIILYMFQKNARKKDTGMIMLGFAVLMFGMETMSNAVYGLRNDPAFVSMLSMFSNPLMGVLVGTVFTAVIQSSSASVGVLQALTATQGITYSAAVPIIMGQNIGTCVSAMISSVGASKNARRAAVIHLLFNVIATLILLPLYYLADNLFLSGFSEAIASPVGIAVVHTGFKILALSILMPCGRLLERLAYVFVPESGKRDQAELLDPRLLATPSVAVARSRDVAVAMAELSCSTLFSSIRQLSEYSVKSADALRAHEDMVDMYEDKLGAYLVRISAQSMTEPDSKETNRILHMIGDFERISDHAMNILDSAEELSDKKLTLSPEAKQELSVITGAVVEIVELALRSFRDFDLEAAAKVEPLEEVVDDLKEAIRHNHVSRLQRGDCTIEAGFVLTDLVTNLERVSDHCSNIAGYMLEMNHADLTDLHEHMRGSRNGDSDEFNRLFDSYKEKYSLKRG